MNIAYYISAHGFGHAARQHAVLRELSQRGHRITVKSTANPKFFALPNVTYLPQAFDVGIVQPDVLTLDLVATFERYRALLAHQDELVTHEATWLREQKIEVVASDMPPMACEFATAAGLPSAVITHFTWDWVYEFYLGDYPQHADVVMRIREAYGKASIALQMPFAHEFTQFRRVEPIPLVANRVIHSRDEVRAEFKIPTDHRMALVSMGGLGWSQGDVSPLRHVRGWTFLLTEGAWEQVKTLPHVRRVSVDYPYYFDLIAAADVMIGKAGWSTVAEVIAHRIPMIYTLRHNWREDHLLESALHAYAHSMYIPLADFERGAWVAMLDDMAQRAYSWRDIPTHGAQVATDWLVSLA